MKRPEPVPPKSQAGQQQSKALLDLVNQVFEIEKKLERIEEQNSIGRNLSRIKNLLEDGLLAGKGLVYHNPLDESYDETRTDCEASIAGESAENLVIVEVIKPIIRMKQDGVNRVVQQGVVIVQSKNESEKSDEQDN